MKTSEPVEFSEWHTSLLKKGPLSVEDVVRVLESLFEQVIHTHERGRVAPLVGLKQLKVLGDAAYYDRETELAPKIVLEPNAYEHGYSVDELTQVHLTEGYGEERNGLVQRGDEPVVEPKYITGYKVWEHDLGHHDALSDIFVLGLVLGSLTLGLSLGEYAPLERFAKEQNRLFVLKADLHPTVALVVGRMTELRRSRRAQELRAVWDMLRDYRQNSISFQSTSAARSQEAVGHQVLGRLRDRLFDVSRRNRLLYFRPTLGMLNLTEASVPLVSDPKRVQVDSLFVYRGEIEKKICNGHPLSLSSFLCFDDAPYIDSVLDKLRAEDRRSLHEFGFSQLRLVLGFLRWHNLKDAPDERISSPLLLLSVRIEKKKGVQDRYLLTPLDHEAEVNPALRHVLHQIYGLELPESITLEPGSVADFHRRLEFTIQATDPNITLNLLEGPSAEVVLRQARGKAELFRRRHQKLSGRGARRFEDIDYSYRRKNYQPLGLQLFVQYAQKPEFPVDKLLQKRPQPRTPFMTSDEGSFIRKSTYQPEEKSTHNRYVWDFDLSSVVLGHFSYRKMSLVRDYNHALGEKRFDIYPALKELLSSDPRAVSDESEPGEEDDENHLEVDGFAYEIVPADPPQRRAIQYARRGCSYIIQGPPGTGKSQTITNLIADCVARGQKVLFVCEKRAALDVVYHRLKQGGLDELCCLIHDSQADKKAVIKDFCRSYEKHLAAPNTLDDLSAARKRLLSTVDRNAEVLRDFDGFMASEVSEHHLSPREGYGRLAELGVDETGGGRQGGGSEARSIQLPSYSDWRRYGDAVTELQTVFDDLGERVAVGQHPVTALANDLLGHHVSLSKVEERLGSAISVLERINLALKQAGFSSLVQEERGVRRIELAIMPRRLGGLLDYANKVSFLVKRHQFALLDPASSQVRDLRGEADSRAALLDRIEEKKAANSGWTTRLSPSDLESALEFAHLEERWYRVVLSSWWRLKKLVHASYDFSGHALTPKIASVLRRLKEEYALSSELRAMDRRFLSIYGGENAHVMLELVERLHREQVFLNDEQLSLREALVRSHQSSEVVLGLLRVAPIYEELRRAAEQVFLGGETMDLELLERRLVSLREKLGIIPPALGALRKLAKGGLAFRRPLVEHGWTDRAYEAEIVRTMLAETTSIRHPLSRLSGEVLEAASDRIQKARQELQSVNAQLICAKVQAGFLEKARRAEGPLKGVTAEEKVWRRDYNRGRKQLEHEFSKVMRYRSLRDLAAGESGHVLFDFKPIWLMSPLSVSDSLPMGNDVFDVVIFDEASQVQVEQAIPALFRAKQAIVVGDEQQLPPTNFFGTRREDDSDEGWDANKIALDAESFLNQAARTLPSRLLAWHYRSRHESLINFSNAAFYNGELLTVPDVHRGQSQDTLIVEKPEDAHHHLEAVLTRPISFHYVGAGVYAERRNQQEAYYIAELVRAFLQSESSLNFGVVAFSEAQQTAIEGALSHLAGQDSVFAQKLDAAYEREDDDQYVGLFVKNLENVQGDERDVIILSICYAPDEKGKMRMNFGPINKTGGEKRLNVVFSRAKQRMVVVSSIRSDAITNDYNFGAACLKRYLRYAELSSLGEYAAAQRVVGEFGFDQNKRLLSRDSVVESLAGAFEELGYRVERYIGTSKLRVDLGVYYPEVQQFALGILVDTEHYYATHDRIEQHVLLPNLLRAFNWPIERVWAKDWIAQRNVVWARLLRRLQSTSTPKTI